MQYLVHSGCERCHIAGEMMVARGYLMPNEACVKHGYPKPIGPDFDPTTCVNGCTELHLENVQDGVKIRAHNLDSQGQMMDYKVKDSGERQTFSSGMVRDTTNGKPDYTSVLDGPMFKRIAAHLTKAKEKYPDVSPGVANWTLADGEEELVRFRKSAFRHFVQWYFGDTDEDHAAATFFNINGAEYVKDKMQMKKQPISYDNIRPIQG